MPSVYEVLTSSGTTAKTLTASNVNPGTANAMYGRVAEEIYLTVEGDTIRFRLDGTAPTATTGHAVGTGASLQVKGMDKLLNFKAITTGTATSTMNISYIYGPKQ